MKKRVIFLLTIGFLFIPGISEAYDINYASLEGIAGDSALLKYRTTSGYTFAICSISGACGTLLHEENKDGNAPKIFPTILNKDNYAKSTDGKLAVVDLVGGGGQGYHVLYEISGDNARFVSLLPHYGPAQRTSISYAGDAVVLFGYDGAVTRYDIGTKKLSSVSTGVTSFPFRSISEHGNYLSYYNYTNKTQDVWSIKGDNKSVSFPAPRASYAVFSDNEKYIAYLNEVGGFNKLFVAEIDNPASAVDVEKGDYTVVEYEFIGNTLYFISNTERDPYAWNMYSYNPVTRELEIVDTDVAYDDEFTNLKKTHTSLFYEKVAGRNKDVIALTPNSTGISQVTLSAVEVNPTTSDITREVVNLDGVPGVLLSPRDARRNQDLPLIVWLHGGPMRQTSVDFHPFYGYAVYDEILERLATEAYVLKLDYTGSWGHGNELREALVGNIGNLDVQDVVDSIAEMKADKNISEVYLIGNSYGGYLALRTLVEVPDEVDAIVSIAGVTDWESLISRIPSSPFSASFYGAPGIANGELYNTASVVNKLNNLDDQKMLIVYGDQDSTVPTWQSTEFSATATMLGKNIETIKYEDEGHTILKKNNLIDLCKQTTATFSLSSSICRE